ncbi:MAG: sulfotransferase family protein [Flavobacteriales bacterium]
MLREFVKNILFNLKKNKATFSPVFIIGCGRSGTTILGNTLSQHPDIKYLNERRDLWHRAYPEFDIWNKNTQNPKLYTDEKDVISKKNNLLHHLFFREQVLENSTILLEKLPINNFRLNFLKKSFPNAKYIYLTRNGLEVSKSIEKRIQKQNWFGGDKYELLKKYSSDNNILLKTKINGDQEKGMWEWKLSIEESNRFFKKENKDNFTHLSYQNFINSPSESIKNIFDFLKLNYTEIWINEISKDIKRKNPETKITEDKSLYLIGGDILNQTIDNSYTPY